MKKIIFIVLFVSIILTLYNPKFYLENKYYGSTKQTEISLQKLNKLVKAKESFALFIYQPACTTSANFRTIIKKFQTKNQIGIYKISFSEIKKSKKYSYIKYYPSFIIFKDGRKVDYLDANDDADTKYYESKNEFKNWFTKYVKLKKTKKLTKINKKKSEKKLQNITLDITKEEGKTSIYLFWGDGCPHCKEEKEFFKSIENEYGKYYNLYTFEVWNSKENENIMNVFAYYMDDDVTGVPYTIIGNESFIGFSDDSKKRIKKAIMKDQTFDVYFDKIK